jgi:hypothetical protein
MLKPDWQSCTDDSSIRRMASEIDRFGYTVIRDFVSPEDLAPVQRLAIEAVEKRNGEYAHFNGTDGLHGTVLEELARSDGFKDLCRRLYEATTGRPGPEVKFYQVFRCLKGRTGQQHSARFHYDSYVLTALLPVALPTKGAPGALLLFPGVRGIRKSYCTNLLDKVCVDNPMSQFALRASAQRRWFGATAMQLRLGDIYFFWGYRSIHANEVCNSDELRATALFHYGNPHEESRSRIMLSQARAR